MIRTLSLFLFCVALLLGGKAVAGPYAATFLVSGYSFELGTDACEFAGPDLCEVNSATGRMECKAERLASGGIGAIMYLIKNESDHLGTDICDGYDYCALGAVETTGTTEETFYCAWNGGSIDEMSLTGTGYEDWLYFHHTQQDGQGALQFDLEEHAGVTDVTGLIFGLGGDDRVHGSRHASTVYFDVLWGDDADDTIWGHAGDDLINAGGGDDEVWAGDGHDTVYLVAGNNHCSTEDGEDTVYGGTGIDSIHLGDDMDYADGAGATDYICGGDDGDKLDGGAEADKLYAGDHSLDISDGEAGSDHCKAYAEYNCESALTAPPSECPDEHETTPAD